MGQMWIDGFKGAGMFSKETMLWNHMRYNCYPPVDDYIEVAKRAIELADVENQEYTCYECGEFIDDDDILDKLYDAGE